MQQDGISYRILAKGDVIKEGDEISYCGPDGPWHASHIAGDIVIEAGDGYRLLTFGDNFVPGDEWYRSYDKSWHKLGFSDKWDNPNCKAIRRKVDPAKCDKCGADIKPAKLEKKYRLLSVGEITCPGDQFFNHGRKWVKIEEDYVIVEGLSPVRREVNDFIGAPA
jgi:hypothetical protein